MHYINVLDSLINPLISNDIMPLISSKEHTRMRNFLIKVTLSLKENPSPTVLKANIFFYKKILIVILI